jgi:hypothetical protein
VTGDLWALVKLFLSEAAAQCSQFIGFDFTGSSCHDVTQEGANQVSLVSFKLEIVYEAAGECCERP